ncbi:hypothetical protein [Crocosphaera watsonii]|uniref:hypothetical protein n=1 Tax=Crocosphaera watsonii TaxID=263511 RepID=UPI0018CFB5EF|nr:hypothetical protein [Crocosphaera watsonii]
MLQHRWQIICFYNGKRQARFTVFTRENAQLWLNWVKRTDPRSNPVIKKVLEDSYEMATKSN